MNERNQTQFWQEKFTAFESGLRNDLALDRKSPLTIFFEKLGFKIPSPFNFRGTNISGEECQVLLTWYKLSYIEKELMGMIDFVENQNTQFQPDKQNRVLSVHYRSLSVVCNRISKFLLSGIESIDLEGIKADFIFFQQKQGNRLAQVNYYATVDERVNSVLVKLKLSNVNSVGSAFFKLYSLLFEKMSLNHLKKGDSLIEEGENPLFTNDGYKLFEYLKETFVKHKHEDYSRIYRYFKADNFFINDVSHKLFIDFLEENNLSSGNKLQLKARRKDNDGVETSKEVEYTRHRKFITGK